MQDNQNYQPQSSAQQPVMQGQPMQANTPQPVQVATKTPPAVWVLATLLMLTILSFGGYVFYNEFVQSESTTVTGNQISEVDNSTELAGPTIEVEELSVDEAIQKINSAVENLSDYATLSYKVTGSDGDENEYNEQFTYDADNNVLKIDSNTISLYGPTAGESFGGVYYKVNDVYYKEDEYDTPLDDGEIFANDFGIEFLKEQLAKYIDDSSYSIEVSNESVLYKNQNVEKISLNYELKEKTSSLKNLFKVYADVILDNYKIEAYINENGQVVKISVPFAYDHLDFEFEKFDEPVDFDLPDSVLN